MSSRPCTSTICFFLRACNLRLMRRHPYHLSISPRMCRQWLLITLVTLGLCAYFWSGDQKPESPPAIAFLFITRESLPLDLLWDAFFQSAPPTKPFTIYVHARPGVQFNSSTTRSRHFLNRHVSNSVQVVWGQSSMIAAEKLLLQTALLHPPNHRFVLLSDSCIFLRSYAYIYDIITLSPNSFVDSFKEGEEEMLRRYNPLMGPTLPPALWRKGSQWFVLTRKHAEAVASDRVLFPLFRDLCKGLEPDPAGEKSPHQPPIRGVPECMPDEHYVQTVLAKLGLESELERRTLTYTQWEEPTSPSQTSWHPATFDYPTPATLKGMQAIEKVEYTSEWRTEWCSANGKPTPCFLFARKFTKHAGLKILKHMRKDVGLEA